MAQVFKRKSALNDLVEHYVYLAENASDEIADRFLSNAESSFLDLASQPQMGTPVATRRAELSALRRWRVKDFEHHLIFYFPCPNGVTILRVLHANQDWWRALGVGSVAPFE
jgi:toxin ParE1/3/4